MKTIPVVRICNPKQPGSYLTINQADFNPAVHVLWTEARSEQAAVKIDAGVGKVVKERRARKQKPVVETPAPQAADEEKPQEVVSD